MDSSSNSSSSAVTAVKDMCRAVRHELEAKERKRVTAAECEAERAREREWKAVDALEQARAEARDKAGDVVALLQRNKELETQLATAMAGGTRLRVQRDTSQLAQAAAKERGRKLLDVLAARGTAASSLASPAVGRASPPPHQVNVCWTSYCATCLYTPVSAPDGAFQCLT